MLDNSLQNKKIIISAGASGIGWATTKICVAKGALVYLCDVDPKAINKVKKHPLYNKRIFVSETEASDETEVIDFFHKIKKKFRNLDSLINNVGVAGPTGTIEKLSSRVIKGTKRQARSKSVDKISNIRDEYLVSLLKMRKKFETKLR